MRPDKLSVYSTPTAPRDADRAAELDLFIARLREQVGYALQPIVNVHSGTVYGYEALLRGYGSLGFRSIAELFDSAWERGCLNETGTVLRDMAVAKFAALPQARHTRLFLNVDPRLLEQDCGRAGGLAERLSAHGLDASRVCLEISEMQDLAARPCAAETVTRLRGNAHLLVIDDFGIGFAGMKLLYECPPDMIKIDRFFVSGIDRDHKKKLFVANAVDLAHGLGVQVIAEGVETEQELLTCRDVGCDLVQGYLIATPTVDPREILGAYPHVGRIARRDRRAKSDLDLIRGQIEYVPPLRVDASMSEVLQAFRRYKDRCVFPVLGHDGRPLGLIHETDLKDFIYSDYGRDLAANKACGVTLAELMRPCPVADVNSSAERVLETYSADQGTAGVILVEDFAYVGFLSASSLLRVLEEKNLAQARDQNPLTRLPGNNSIVEYVSSVAESPGHDWTLVYFDFDHFKPFNDTYGFRQGDRAITLFAELMRKFLGTRRTFCGHVGGDDFFAGFRDVDEQTVRERVERLLAVFRSDVESFYDPASRARGRVAARDRDGSLREFPLLSCSAAIVRIASGASPCSVDQISTQIARLKKRAKDAPGRIAAARLTR